MALTQPEGNRQADQESRDRYRDLYDFAPIGYLTLNRAAEIIEANLTSAALFGLTREELLNRHFKNLVSPEDSAGWSSQFMNSFMDGQDHGAKQCCELALRRADGSQFQARLDCLHIERDGETPTVRIALTDITERWLAQQHLAGLVESAMDAIVSVDENQHIVLFNPAAERMFGLPASQALGQSIHVLLPEDARSDHVEHIRNFARTGETSRILGNLDGLRGQRINGEIFPIEASLTQVEAQGRRLFTVILREISERKRVEETLRRERDTTRNILQTVEAIILALDTNGRITLINRKGCDLLGWSEAELIGRDWFSTCLPRNPQADAARKIFHKALSADPTGSEYYENPVRTRSGQERLIAWHNRSTRDAEGNVIGGLSAGEDITERKRAEQALIEADQRKDEFLAMLGHELRNPLAPIRNAAHVLGRLETREPQVRWAREIIERQVVYLTRLVDDLVDVSRIARGKVALQPEILSLASLVDQALVMARPLIEAKGHRFELRLPETPVWLRGDPVRLAQVLLNLLDNAAKYTHEGGCIKLAADVVGGGVEIKLRDNGIGISSELQPRVFDLFKQDKRALDRAQGGLGIGLTLAKQLVEMHGGQIDAVSAGPGLGSEFTIRLPILADAASAGGDNKPKAATASCRVLVVDDDDAVAESMTALLAIEGHHVKTATNGAAALELARGFHPQLVLLDIGLGGMDGYEVARRLRDQQSPDEKPYLVAVTGYGHEEARARAREAGFDRHLVKPVFPEIICELLAELLRPPDKAG
ncbi:MAG: hypothetical protein B7Y41_04990 [Hydrogenophilales bacterium 28-61-23]|nr:MAG: hypothetical protein B7Y41_04990 [Hydrogenophilales bacterium 28-61-23]